MHLVVVQSPEWLVCTANNVPATIPLAMIVPFFQLERTFRGALSFNTLSDSVVKALRDLVLMRMVFGMLLHSTKVLPWKDHRAIVGSAVVVLTVDEFTFMPAQVHGGVPDHVPLPCLLPLA